MIGGGALLRSGAKGGWGGVAGNLQTPGVNSSGFLEVPSVLDHSCRHETLGGEKNARTDSTLIRFEGVFVSLTESGGDDATAVQHVAFAPDGGWF